MNLDEFEDLWTKLDIIKEKFRRSLDLFGRNLDKIQTKFRQNLDNLRPIGVSQFELLVVCCVMSGR